MGNKKMVKITSFVILVAIVAVSLVAGTYAKYTTTVSGSDTAIVAKWDVSDGNALANFNIFDVSNIYDTNGVSDYTAAGVADLDVQSNTDIGAIAPGTWGKFSYEISNNSDVNASYEIDYTVDEKGVFLQWSTDGKAWSDSLADVDSQTIKMGNKINYTIYWRWVYDGTADSIVTGQTDTSDTALGEADSLVKPTIAVNVTFTQID